VASKKSRKNFTSRLETDFKRVKSCEKSTKARRKNVRQDIWKHIKDEDYDDDLRYEE